MKLSEIKLLYLYFSCTVANLPILSVFAKIVIRFLKPGLFTLYLLYLHQNSSTCHFPSLIPPSSFICVLIFLQLSPYFPFIPFVAVSILRYLCENTKSPEEKSDPIAKTNYTPDYIIKAYLTAETLLLPNELLTMRAIE